MRPDPANGRRSKIVIISGISSAQVLGHYATANVLRCAWELCRNLGDAVDQAAWLAGISMTSTPFWNLTPRTILGNYPFVRTVR